MSIDLVAERRQCLRDIEHYQGILARVPDDRRHQVALENETAHLGRVEHQLRQTGWKP